MILPVYINKLEKWFLEIHVLCIPLQVETLKEALESNDKRKVTGGKDGEKEKSKKYQYQHYFEQKAFNSKLDMFTHFSEIPHISFYKEKKLTSSPISKSNHDNYEEVIEEYKSWIEEISKGDSKKSREENISRAVYFRIKTKE